MKPTIPRFWQTAVLVLVVVGLLLLSLSGFMGSLFKAAQSPLVAAQRWISTRYLAVYEFITAPRDMASIRQENAELKNQVALLQTQIIELQQQLSEASVLYALLDFARSQPENTYVAATVIGRDPNPFLKYILIDQGSDAGLRNGCLLYTSDAADDLLCVDLGGRRIIKKKNNKHRNKELNSNHTNNDKQTSTTRDRSYILSAQRTAYMNNSAH